MLLDIGIRRAPAFLLAHNALAVNPARTGIANSLSAREMFGDTVPTIADLPASAVHENLLGVFVLNGKEIIDVSKAGIRARAEAATTSFDWVFVLHRPLAHIKIVNMLFNDMVTANPDKVVPVA